MACKKKCVFLLLGVAAVLAACSDVGESAQATVTFHSVQGTIVDNLQARTLSMIVDKGSRIVPPKVWWRSESVDSRRVFSGWSSSTRADAAPYDLTKGVHTDTDFYPIWNDDVNDWLFLLYIDGDNNLNDMLFADMNEAEAGIYAMSDEVTVKAVVFWDGINAGNSAIYELGPDMNPKALGAFTVDVSETAPWIQDGEADMSSPENLTNFLVWAKNRYPAKKVVLQFSDHGAGPRNVRSLAFADKSSVSGLFNNRAMLTDDTTGYTSLMYSNQVSQALSAALEGDSSGYWQRIGLILFDICLGSSIEDAFEVSRFASYMVASPCNIPSYGMDYAKLFGGIQSDFTVLDLGKKLISDYKIDYGRMNNNALSLVDLHKVAILRSRMERVSALLLEKGGSKVFPKVFTTPYNGELRYSYKEAAGVLLQNQNMTYSGSFTYLHDIGAFVESLFYYASPMLNKDWNRYEWPELYNAAADVQEALAKAIVVSWSNGAAGLKPFPAYEGDNQLHGLTIVGRPSSRSGGVNYPGWYKTDLAYGDKSSWADLLDFWYTKIWNQ